ncbi:DUF2254 domain-containing protein [Sabulicella rubraurantiaca]|uniref:DUF2254 domain-containing protein n=1 Tax=Sabulicella rubraurantiaca TaxID=2811429 RepID=UPI001A9770FA|nr:DUF2254 domain-containing protein [Sabulicella rubraurantiaca]
MTVPGAAWLRRWALEVASSFWLRPSAMVVAAVVLAELLVRHENSISLPGWMEAWIYAGGISGARGVLAAVAGAMIGVAGTTFSITVAALSLASDQMGPRLLGNFTRDPGNQYALGALLATFAFSLVTLRAVREVGEEVFVPQLAVSVALLLAGICVGVVIWFIHHVASSINMDNVVALVREDLTRALRALPRRADGDELAQRPQPHADAGGGKLRLKESGYLRLLDDEALADWAEKRNARLRLLIRPGDFVFPGRLVGEVQPPELQEEAEKALSDAASVGRSRIVNQDLEFAVNQMVEIAARALPPGVNDSFTAIAVLDQFGAVLCEMEERLLPDGVTWRGEVPRLWRSASDYAGIVDAMFHMIRQSGAMQPPVMIRLMEVLGAVAEVERDAGRLEVLRHHLELAHGAACAATEDPSAQAAYAERREAALRAIAGEEGKRKGGG